MKTLYSEGWVSYLEEEYDNDYCRAGYYCAAGSEAPTVCDAGHYCPIPLMAALDSTKTCTPGFDCTGGSNTPTPLDCLLDGEDCGNICQPGYYCEGDVAAQPCPQGTFYPAKGA